MLMAESKEELKSLLIKVKEESEKAGLTPNIKKTTEFQKNIYFCFTDCTKAFDCVNHNKLWKNLQKMGIPDQLTCLLRNLYAGHEATVRTGTWNNILVPNRKRSTSRLYIVTLLI